MIAGDARTNTHLHQLLNLPYRATDQTPATPPTSRWATALLIRVELADDGVAAPTEGLR